MQLFVTDFKQNGDKIIISNPEILEQTRKVLRMKIGDKFFVQKENKRYQLEISSWDKFSITGKILETILQTKDVSNKNTGIVVAMPNKWSKAELIVQKLSEIGVDEIYFRPSERSVLKDWNNKKGERLQKISQEAVEQSRGWKLPKIEFVKNIFPVLQNKKIIVFDMVDQKVIPSYDSQANIIGIVGPEGGFTQKDYENFGKNFDLISLGDTVLRMETASIVGAWLLRNSLR
ncbi:MAG TPA: RsmE family RNA methyltransferase [Candidatus Absconditabacterales bacterium]|nr:RsmE family RNA methyltransferase [Candidatus Absconditabacterales bacterium]HPK27595.1 RsmE family RNA methyltransferase [Candidatus Absconditabacterales bacterium]